MKNIERFIESVKVANTAKVVRFVFKNTDVDIENYNQMELEQFILDLKPNSPKSITTICYVLGLYAKWLQEQNIIKNDNLYQMIQSLDKKLLWKKAKPTAKKKFISYEQYEIVIKDIATYEEYNALHYELLFSCIWSGVYNDDLSVLKNLRASNIEDDGMLTLHEDNGHIYKFKVSERLAKDLKQLSIMDTWQRPNRFGICNVNMRGIYNDSVFKIENRSTASQDSFRFTFYAKLRKIAKEYLEQPLLPLQLYASGLVYRIKVELEKNNISLEEAFAENSRNRMAHLIIQKELTRCNSNFELSNFRELIKGHLDSF